MNLNWSPCLPILLIQWWILTTEIKHYKILFSFETSSKSDSYVYFFVSMCSWYKFWTHLIYIYIYIYIYMENCAYILLVPKAICVNVQNLSCTQIMSLPKLINRANTVAKSVSVWLAWRVTFKHIQFKGTVREGLGHVIKEVVTLENERTAIIYIYIYICIYIYIYMSLLVNAQMGSSNCWDNLLPSQRSKNKWVCLSN